jgi:hypothetical protein
MKRDVLDLALLLFLLTGLGAVVVVLDATVTKDAPWLNGDRHNDHWIDRHRIKR